MLSASAMGLWIEIQWHASHGCRSSRQPLRWGCGLKLLEGDGNQIVLPSASAMGLWIEITYKAELGGKGVGQPLRWGCGLKLFCLSLSHPNPAVSLCYGAVD